MACIACEKIFCSDDKHVWGEIEECLGFFTQQCKKCPYRRAITCNSMTGKSETPEEIQLRYENENKMLDSIKIFVAITERALLDDSELH